MKILTDDEIWQIGMQDISLDAPYGYARAIESAVLEKLKAQEPEKWTPAGFCDDGEPLYRHQLPPDDVVRDPRVAKLEAVLREIRSVAPREVECHNMHHAKKDRHEFDETCPVVSRYAEAIAKIDEVLNVPYISRTA